MANISIDTTDPAYQTALNRVTQLRDLMRPRLKIYFQLDDAQQAKWRAKDPILRGVLDWADRIATSSEQ